MRLIPDHDTNINVLGQDIFGLLGMQKLPVIEKESFLTDLLDTVTQYFLQEKLQDNLTSEQMQSLMKKYPNPTKKDGEAMLEDIGEMLPNAGELYTEALAELESKLVIEHYKKLVTNREKAYKDGHEKIETARKNLAYAISGKFELINVNLESN